MDNVRWLVVFVGNIDYSRRRFELQVGDEGVTKVSGLQLDLLVLGPVGQGEQHAVLAARLHLPRHSVQLGVLQPHPLHDLQGGALVGQRGPGQVAVAGHVVHPHVGHLILQPDGAGPADGVGGQVRQRVGGGGGARRP